MTRATLTCEHMRTLSGILRIVHATLQTTDRGSPFPTIARHVHNVVACDFVSVGLMLPSQNCMLLHSDFPDFERRPGGYKAHDFYVPNFHSGIASVVGIDDLARYPVNLAMWEQFGIREGLLMPMFVEARTIGVLGCFSKAPGAFASVDRDLATNLGTVVAVAVDRQLTYERMARLGSESDVVPASTSEPSPAGLHALIGRSYALSQVREHIEVVAPTPTTVLITGESGTGKDMVAHAIHGCSSRRERPMITINCATLPPQLAESELFGYEEGAFTGALRRRIGRCEAADNSTLFLDEIADLSLDVQAKLLRVLQERTIERVGGSGNIPIDIRVIAATNRDLAHLISTGRFREDLYYRLAVFSIHVPPLRERREDLRQLVETFVERAASRFDMPAPRITVETLRRLSEYDWPGNVRELQNVIERAMIVGGGDTLPVEAMLPRTLQPERPADPEALRAEYLAALEATSWVIDGADGAAMRVGIHPNTFRNRIKRLGIERPR